MKKSINILMLATLLASAVFTVMPAQPAKAAPATIILGNYPYTSDSSGFGYPFYGEPISVSFTMGATDVDLTEVALQLACSYFMVPTSCGTPTVTLQGDNSGSPDGNVLATFTGPGNIPNLADWWGASYDFTTTPVSLTPGTTYWIVVVDPATPADTQLLWMGDWPDKTPTGSYATYNGIHNSLGLSDKASFELRGDLASAPPSLVVDNTGDVDDGDFSAGQNTLREALTYANAGDTISFDPSLSGAIISLSSTLTIDKNVSIDGSALASPVTISGGGAVRVFYVNAGVVASMNRLSIINGYINDGTEGGGIMTWGDLAVTNSSFTNNISTFQGGGIAVGWGGSLSVTNSTFTNNQTATGWCGGGINNDGVLTVNASTFTGNQARCGGAISGGGTAMSILASTFENNTASEVGGALFTNRLMSVTNSTFYQNTASDRGGGVFVGSGTLNLLNDTFAFNGAYGGGYDGGESGGAIFNEYGTISIINTIMAYSTAGSDCRDYWGTFGTMSNNLIMDYTYCVDSIRTDPGLGSLQANGGPTATMAITNTSPAFNAGSNAYCPTYDQRGEERAPWASCDIGAYEAKLLPPPVLTAVVNSLNDPGTGTCDVTECTLREAIAFVDAGGTITFDPALAGGTITLGSTLTLGKDVTIDGSALASQITISGNDAVRVFYINAGVTANITSLEVTHGSSSGPGGGIYNLGTLNITNSTFARNQAHDGMMEPGDGGGISNQGTLTITGSTFYMNFADGNGGAISLYNGSLTVTNSTFWSNRSYHVNGLGGAIMTYINTTATIMNSTISDGLARPYLGGGGGIFNQGTLQISNNIISDSVTGVADCVNYGGTISVNVNNLVEDGTCSAALSGDPGLGTLQDNGGPTDTMAIDFTSLAYNAGNDAVCPADDQRGVTRAPWAPCDIGAYEYDLPVNQAPLITEGASVSVTMSEDSSPTPFSLTLHATDAEGDTLTWSILTPATNGTAGASGTGNSMAITYTSDANFNGSDSFVVQVSDGNGGTDTITVNVTVNPVNDLPVISENDPVSVNMSEDGNPTPFSLTLHATDPDQEPLTWSILTPAVHGTASTVPASGIIHYTPNLGYIGTDTFVVSVSDGNGGTDNIVVNVTIANTSKLPLRVTLLKPSNGASTTGLRPTFSWKTSQYSVGYHIQVSRNSNFTGLVVDQMLTGTSLTPAYDLPLGKLFWRVQGYNARGQYGPWSVVWTLNIKLAAPALVSPTSGMFLYTGRPTFVWEPVPGATSYIIQASRSSTFANPVINRAVTGTSYTPPANVPEGALFWRVKAVNGGIVGPWSPGWRLYIAY
jgi:CSLREA domain-containing protein